MTKPVRIGLLGYGFGGKYFHAPLIASAAGCELAGVVTRSPERRTEVDADHPGVPVFDSLEQLAEAGVDAVAISTPAATHTELTRQAIEMGLPVVCDKPFAMTADEARATVELAETAGVLVTPYQNRRWDSDLLTLRRLIDEAALGQITHFESKFERFADPAAVPLAGGGILRDFGSHLVDQALFLFGPVSRVYGELASAGGPAGEAGFDRKFFAALTHASGVVSHLTGDWSQGAPGNRYRVQGTKGSYTVRGIAGMDGQEHALIAGKSPASEGDQWGAEPQEVWGQIRRGDESTTVETERGRWDTFYPTFAAAVRGQGSVPVNPWDAVASMTVIDAVRTSASSGKVVEL